MAALPTGPRNVRRSETGTLIARCPAPMHSPDPSARVGVIDYGLGNLQSVLNACERLQQPAFLVHEPSQLAAARAIILPGVAAFDQGMRNLQARGLVEPLRDAVLTDKKPLLGLCLGMQLLADWGSEGQGAAGLGLIPGTVERFPEGSLRVPHIGWNSIHENPSRRCRLPVRDGIDFYFVHSFYFKPKYEEDVVAWTDYGVRFASIVGRDHIVGCQFHPEKSHQAGMELLAQFFGSLC